MFSQFFRVIHKIKNIHKVFQLLQRIAIFIPQSTVILYTSIINKWYQIPMVLFLALTLSFIQGANTSSQLEKELSADHVLANEHFYGLINVRIYISVVPFIFFTFFTLVWKYLLCQFGDPSIIFL